MLKKVMIGAALLASVPAQAAVTVSFENGGSTLDPATTIIEDFEGYAAGDALDGSSNAFAYDSSPNGIAARPAFGSTGNYGAVLGVPTSGSYTINFATARIFSFALGSLDTYNTLTLLFSDGTSTTYNGAQINQGATADGNQISGLTNGRVTYTVGAGDPWIVGANFVSNNQNSFEFDDLATAAVPEPATWAMMIFGFLGMAHTLRRRRKEGRNIAFA